MPNKPTWLGAPHERLEVWRHLLSILRSAKELYRVRRRDAPSRRRDRSRFDKPRGSAADMGFGLPVLIVSNGWIISTAAPHDLPTGARWIT